MGWKIRQIIQIYINIAHLRNEEKKTWIFTWILMNQLIKKQRIFVSLFFIVNLKMSMFLHFPTFFYL